MSNRIARYIGMPLATLVAAQGCDTRDSDNEDPRAAEIAAIEVDGETVHGLDHEGSVVSDANFTIEGAVSRVEMTFEDGTLTTEMDGSTAEVRLFGEIGGESFAWSSLDGEALPSTIAGRVDAIGAAWQSALLDDQGQLRPEVRASIVMHEGNPDAVAYWDWWSFACGAGMLVACAPFAGPAAWGCGMAGVTYCAAISY